MYCFWNINFIKKETLAQVFSCEFYEISQNNFSTEHVQTTASWEKYNDTKFDSFRSLVRKFTETINSSRSAKKLVLRGYFLFFCPTRVTMEGGDILHILMYKNILDEKGSTLLQKATVPHFNHPCKIVKYYRKNTPSSVSYHNLGQNIWRLFHVSTQVLLTGSETELNHYY